MKRVNIIKQLINEGFTDKFLSKLNDRQLKDLSERVLSEQTLNIPKDDKASIDQAKNEKKQFVTYEEEGVGDDISDIEDEKIGYTLVWLPRGLSLFLYVPDSEKIEDAYVKLMTKFNQKTGRGMFKLRHELEYGNVDGIPYIREYGLNGNVHYFKGNSEEDMDRLLSMINKSHNWNLTKERILNLSDDLPERKGNMNEWVEGVIKKNYHTNVTTKKEIYEMIGSLSDSADKLVDSKNMFDVDEQQPSPSRPGREAPVREKPGTRPDRPKRENPFEPKHTPKPKAKLPKELSFNSLGLNFKMAAE